MIKLKGLVLLDPLGSPYIEMRNAANQKEVDLFLKAGMGKEVEIVIAAPAELLLTSTVTERKQLAEKAAAEKKEDWKEGVDKPMQLPLKPVEALPQEASPAKKRTRRTKK